MRTHDYLLVGGGIVGACLAEELARTGASVLVLDAGPAPGHATRQAAGVAVPSLRYLGRPALYDWLCAGRDRLEHDIARLEPGHGAFSVARPIVRALKPADADAHAERLDRLPGTRWAALPELASLAPGLKLPEERRYLLDPRGLMIDGGRYLEAVHRSCLSAGVDWRQDTEVRDLTESPEGVTAGTPRGTFAADRAVLTAGAWAGGRLAPGLPVRPLRGQLVVLDTPAELPLIFSSALYLAPGIGGGVIVGATEEDAGFDERCTAGGIAGLLRFAASAAPALASAAPRELRAGLRPATTTGTPLIGRIPGRDRTYVAAGHAGHGLLSARLTAEGLAGALTADRWDPIPEEFCPSVTLTAGGTR